MKLWLIKLNPDYIGYDYYCGHIVEAKSSERVREIVNEKALKEGSDEVKFHNNIWRDQEKARVTHIGEGNSDIETVWLSDFNAG